MRIIVIALLLAASSRAHADATDHVRVAVIACERGDAKSCLKAAVRLKALDGRRVLAHTPRARGARATSLFKLQCENGDADACLAFGRRLIADDNAKRGYAALDRACSLGSGEACLEVGNDGKNEPRK